jgi:hypothetical protein
MIMDQLQYGLINNTSMLDFLEVAGSSVDRQNWLFVAIDSSRGEHFARALNSFCAILGKHQIESWAGPEGLWIPGKFLKDVVYKTDVIVPYSAAYIFDCRKKAVDSPKYTKTSESDDFSRGEPELLKIELERLGASGYVADGDGLNFAICGRWADDYITVLTGLRRSP